MITIATSGAIYSAAQVEESTTRLMASIAALPVDNGVGILVDCSYEGVLLMLAAIRLGLRTAVCPAREPPEIIADWLSSLGITTMITAGAYKEFAIATVSELLRDDVGACLLDRSPEFTSLLRTSGTTGVPKTAIISARAHKASAQSVCSYFSYEASSSWALTLPLYHVSGLSIIFRALHARSSLFLAPNHEEIIAGLARQRISHLSLVPTQLMRLLHQDVDLSSLCAVVIGGDALPKALLDESRRRGVPVHETYGLTETASMVWAYDPISDAGGLLPHATLAISPAGEILVGGASLFSGFVDERAGGDEMFATGDLGHIRGHELVVHGRTHHRIISGGENIQAEEIERVLELHPAIASAVVVGIADNNFGMRPCAIIKWRAQSLALPVVDEYLRAHLASYKIPKAIFTWPHYAPDSMKKPRQWLQRWLLEERRLDKPVIVGA